MLTAQQVDSYRRDGYHQGSIYENQRSARWRFFKIHAEKAVHAH